MSSSCSQYPFPNNFAPVTPNNNNTAPSSFNVAPGAPLRPETRRGLTEAAAAARQIVFECEERLTSDESEEEPEMHLNATDIRFLQTQNDLVIAEYDRLRQLRLEHQQKAVVALLRLKRIDSKLSQLQTRSWTLVRELGRTDRSDYIGL